ncbi:MAG: 3-oxoacyl-[acyl-carrier-protein] reductase [Gammaproteobacteria bacterium]|jgi:3-oxoacyl-[acyl-carrier protein] reductase|nr:3-oxoacyl-[acyl-carrier-protein] reductase [Gammaproteobacteria bacterium]MDP7153405.1 3-oxoacyl-[acyl-carrier-protein] reductase [Gammaproteobacteria bacterium]MDP7296875.1 3-oxoacyl-[acyl-carrier-protein] reductase [Gammaproteobacteria bacterium]MDP7419351.1 3-oxoacyl-[acyl-carrier-protein] reductase [Gammaproteobacteria bacterium]MDP7660128.1 3-oxoacyl-[acyl-carrier-protein] reductase [Gammaproteobacteria bacterium]
MSGAKILDGKLAIVTGGCQGIGKSTAIALAEAGANIAIIDVAEAVEETAAEIRQYGVQVKAYRASVMDFAEITQGIEQIHKDFGSIDILVNNAGITRDNLLLRMKEEDWDLVLGINLKGVFNCTKAVARIMLKQRSGKIVNVASVVGITGNAGQCNYSASKAGVIGFTKSSAREFASRGVCVNAIAPGFIQTAMTDSLGDDTKLQLEQQIPMQKLGSPEDVANVVVFLSGPASDYVTGEVIRIDGGMAM